MRNVYQRRTLLKVAAAGMGASALAVPRVWAQSDYPSKPIQVIIAHPPGGTSDVLVRYVAQKMSIEFKQPVIVQNRGAGGGRPALMQASRSAPDGYTLCHGYAGTFSINAGLYRDRLEYSPEKGFTPLAPLGSGQLFLYVHPSVPARNVAEFVAYAKANPGKLSYGSAGVGSTNHFAAELFKTIGGFESLHVPFNGSAPAHTALMGGHVLWTFDTGNVMQYVKAGRVSVIALGVPKRAPAMPDLPTIAETYPGFDAKTWHGMFGPAGMPPDIVRKLNRSITQAMGDADGLQLLNRVSMEPLVATADEFASFLQADIRKWLDVAVRSNIKATD
ncbi:MAG: tripartite tricarboxylate transporter substrate-binding protein [Burkholderiaceae bacterium]|nr:tripartite tricarboxylate transporter substrate-binding protein [Burkholderiaceae bacterium]